jgi:hypothetical protein
MQLSAASFWRNQTHPSIKIGRSDAFNARTDQLVSIPV